ncbi:hypothetical protein M422DRAFT_266674 [Sphaerobolus stellatus SS14]|uniref:Uncharacterized protein n=1 Tax=Sphaerobolus stellatus (strain SS14) TaxID=990650 RepID=A0A0C9V269_SPHS4|nr:hypothetical protein M422DRAFT_266674 [Sphaerobolus stellatus SS14]
MVLEIAISIRQMMQSDRRVECGTKSGNPFVTQDTLLTLAKYQGLDLGFFTTHAPAGWLTKYQGPNLGFFAKSSLGLHQVPGSRLRAKASQLYDRLDSRRVTIQNLTDQVQSLEKELQETKDNSAKLSRNEDIILENKHLKRELDYYVGRAQYALHGKDAAWAEKNGYRLSDIPASDGEDDNEDPTGLPTIPEDIPQYIPVIREAGIPAIGGYRPSPKQKRIIADPPASITGVLPKPLGKTRAERGDQPAFRGASEWILEQDVHDVEMRRLYAEAKALPPHQRTPDHTAVMLRIDEYARSLPGLPRNLVAPHDDPDWMTDVIQSFNSNPSGVP